MARRKSSVAERWQAIDMSNDGLSSAAQINFKPYNETAMSMFLTSDTDHDACFERTELDHVFVVYDTDGSGTVSRHEYTVHITATNPELHDFAHVLYDDYDLDGDHHLEKHDYDAYFAKLDADSDGCVTPDEFVNYWTVGLKNNTGVKVGNNCNAEEWGNNCNGRMLTDTYNEVRRTRRGR
ncbi:Hypothetical predicted protein, partial [Mytilus galloprovincialis]